MTTVLATVMNGLAWVATTASPYSGNIAALPR